MSKLKPTVNSNDHFQGNANAPIVLVEYGDYECPYCGRAYPIIKNIQLALGRNLKFVFRNFPLAEVHSDAIHAAIAAEAASTQGKFWEMHNILFANRRNLGTTSLKLHSREAGVQNKRFLDELVNATYGWQVQGDMREGINRGVKDVPTFFVNGERFTGKVTYDELSKAVEAALKKVKKKVPAKAKV